MNSRLVTYLEDAGLVLATFLILETIAVLFGLAAATWVIVFGCFAGLLALRLTRR